MCEKYLHHKVVKRMRLAIIYKGLKLNTVLGRGLQLSKNSLHYNYAL